jgi:hypothetical protein
MQPINTVMKINEIETPANILITIPATISWEDYEKELAAVADHSQVMRFKVARLPTRNVIGGRCYLCYQGHIIGWMKIVGTHSGEFTCSTTGQQWSGDFIERSGPFNRLVKAVPHKGFQGWRYFSAMETDRE